MTSETWIYIATSFGWSIGGFVIGWVACRLTHADEDAEEFENMKGKITFQHIVGIFLVMLAFATLINYAQQAADERCRNDFQAKATEVTRERARYADEDRAAFVDFLKKYPEASGDRLATDQLIAELLLNYQRTQTARDAAPLPKLEEECG